MIKNPEKIISILSQSIPATSNFYIAYMILKVFLLTPLQLFRIPDILIAMIRPCFCGSSRTRKERRTPRCACYTIDHPGRLYWGKLIPDYLLVFLITLTFSTMSPLILPGGMLYFAVSLFIYHQQLLFVYTKGDGIQSGGQMWPFAFRMMCIAFVVYHLATIAVMSLNVGLKSPKVYIMIPALIGDVSIMYYMIAIYSPVCEVLPLFTAVSADEAFGDSFIPRKDAYQHPSLSAPDALTPEVEASSSGAEEPGNLEDVQVEMTQENGS